ncbi:MAG: DUF4956 domain-containing protein [Clostridia bacterium]|nr:DUF4956 domain-containing protein [Clostridia bacterium]
MSQTLSTLMESTLNQKALNFSLIDCLICLACAFALGCLIALTYKKTYRGVMYSSTYGITLVAMTMVSTLILMVVTSNVVLTLGMVGALSIIRFRTAIKEPMDVMFMFWAVAAGIVVGAGLLGMAAIGCIVIAVVLFILANRKQIGSTPYVLVVRMQDPGVMDEVMNTVKPNVTRMQIKNKTITGTDAELTLDVRLKNDDAAFVTPLSKLPGVMSAALVTYNGEYIS